MASEGERADEEWRPVVGYEGLYSVSNYGRVKGEKRVIIRANGWPIPIKEIVLRPAINRGYLYVNLKRDAKGTTQSVHRLVAAAFLGASDLEVMHQDNNPSNNRLENLRYGTRAENLGQAKREGRNQACNGVRRGRQKLTVEQAGEIIRMIGTDTNAAIAARFNITPSTVGQIAARKTWREHPARKI